jgi:hypothetical protein
LHIFEKGSCYFSLSWPQNSVFLISASPVATISTIKIIFEPGVVLHTSHYNGVEARGSGTQGQSWLKKHTKTSNRYVLFCFFIIYGYAFLYVKWKDLKEWKDTP